MRPLLLHFYNAVWINLANADVHSSEMWALMPIHLYIYAPYMPCVDIHLRACATIQSSHLSHQLQLNTLSSTALAPADAAAGCFIGLTVAMRRTYCSCSCSWGRFKLLHLCCCSLLLFVMWQLHCAYSFVVFFFLLLLPLRSDICHIIMINTALPLLLLLQTI